MPGRRNPLALLARPLPRRVFLSRALGWITAAIASVVAAPGLVAAISPAFRKSNAAWSPIGRVGPPEPGAPDLTAAGKPVLTSFTSMVQDAYLKAMPQSIGVYAVNRGGGRFTVFDVRCTHLGCPVSFKESDGKYYSPCHGGVFDGEGRVLAGPPPRPLDRYEVKVEDGVLYAGRLYRVNDRLERVT